LKCRNVVRGLSLVLHDPEGSHYIDLELEIGSFYREQRKKLNPQLRGIKASDAIKAFEKAGGISKSGKGDHINIKMPNGRIITSGLRMR